MTHPLHKPCPIEEFTYRFGLTVLADNEYWEIYLKETETTSEFVKRHIWENGIENVCAEVTQNNKYVIITIPGETPRTTLLLLSENKPPVKTKPDKISRIHEDKERRKKREEFRNFLKELGLSFNIDFYHYREDSDRMTVTYKGKEIFSGTTEDL